MARIIAFANQKGGVAKTTSVVSVGASLAGRGRSVLAVDLDPQAGLTYSLGVEPDSMSETINDVLVRRLPIDKVVLTAEFDFVPSNIDLAGAEPVLLAKTGREYALQRALRDVESNYDYIIIDCPPSLGILTINGLTAAHEVIIPLQCEALSHRGVGQLLETITDIRHFTNAALKIAGVVATMYDGRTRHGRTVLQDIGPRYGLELLGPPVRRSIRFAEAAQQGHSLLAHAPEHAGAHAYREIAALIDEGSS